MIFLQELTSADTFEWFNKLPEKFFVRLLVDLLTVTVLIRLIYYRIYRRTDLFLTFFGFNLIIFLITYLLNKVQMSMGAAFGLFAVFSMLRYRTEGLSAKDMTYLFIVISLGLISAIIKGSWDELGLVNGMIVLAVWLLEGNWLIKRELTKNVQYDKIELIVPERRAELIRDLRARTGLDIHRVEVQTMDFLRDSALIMIFYYQTKTKNEQKSEETVLENV
ncbi:DUF4956 domain-containing protein [Runella slithyformis]|uniref:DUF4956 domain-containing protein n=1 Tax=Runella slithyformis (strain ATCC 29530 / DSM 19594 / LMG 11500 / NCIMB 11436 / LSU 4) TaxID=761193 RepID=A0A7U3ZJX0_RUNSL|nr:DUF4956 domain-containing protein [Runella slithyformis]AEI48517.1 hypothetical protein Runsl_2102 [Runella slithyformis DSM 19594]